MKNKVYELFLIFYPILVLVGFPFLNYSLIDSVRNGIALVTMPKFYIILFFFVISILLFKDVLIILKSLRIYSIIIGLFISIFFTLYTLFPSVFFFESSYFFQIYFYNYLTVLYMSMSMLSVYSVLFLLKVKSSK